MLDIWDMLEDEFIIVELDSLLRPIGEEGRTLTRFIGSLVRKHQCAPINYGSWKDMPDDYKQSMLKTIMTRFEILPKLDNDKEEILANMLKSEMCDKWRQWKHDLKKMGYDPSKTEEQMAANIPDERVDPLQYRDLAHYWCSDKGQKLSDINKRNRAKLEDIRCMGTKSLPRFINEKNGKTISRLSFSEI